MHDEEIKTWLTRRFGEDVRFDEPMARHTSLGVGGPARAWLRVRQLPDLAALVRQCTLWRMPWMVAGDGTNLLVRDGGFPGLVVVMAGALREIRLDPAGPETTTVCAMAGARLAALCRLAVEKGLAGLNFALGIPGTVGGAVRMNAGTDLGWLSHVLTGITVMTPEGEIRSLDRSALTADYRSLTWPEAEEQVVVEARLALRPEDPETLAREAARRLDQRRSSQPVSHPSAGCFFKNPDSGPGAGELMDRAGLKGRRCGDAEISAGHANFIVNRGRARAADIIALMELAQKEVARRFGVSLEPEVRIVGDP